MNKFNNNEREGNKYYKEFYEILLNNISLPDFDILSNIYIDNSKSSLINKLVESIFTLVKNQFPSEEDKAMVNSKTKAILNKIILPFFEPNIIKQENGENIPESVAPIILKNFSTEKIIFLIIISSILI